MKVGGGDIGGIGLKARLCGAIAGALLACGSTGTAFALALPSPSPLPSLLPAASPLPLPTVSPLAVPTVSPLPLPTTSPLPLTLPSASPLPVTLPSSSPLPVLGTVLPQGGQTGGTGGTGTGGTGTQSGGGGSPPPGGVVRFVSAYLAGSGGSHQPVRGPLLFGRIPLPAFPGLPAGVAQDVVWTLMVLLPVLLLVWVVSLIRTIGKMALWRNSASVLAAAADLGLSPREIAGLSPAAIEKVREQLAVDELTGCMRRAAGVAALEREVARARREKNALAVAFVDADGLKAANDAHGHAAGDALLRDIAEGLRTRLRGSDFVFRYGGDEFVCVMPGAGQGEASHVLTDVQGTLRAAGRSFSLGIAELQHGDDTVQLLARADEQLYAAKRARRIGRDFEVTKLRGKPVTSRRESPETA